MESLLPIGLVLLLVLAAEFVNGWTDAPNAIATVVSTRVLSPYQALGLASAFNVLGAMSGTAVAATIGKGIVKPEAIGLATVAAAMVAIVFWSTLAWYYGLPTSESHALIAGLSGVAIAAAGLLLLLPVGALPFLVTAATVGLYLFAYTPLAPSGIYGGTFYTLIGAHALHVLAALAWLSIILMGTRSGTSATPNRSRVLVFGMYWYFVVGLWPILYTLVYLA